MTTKTGMKSLQNYGQIAKELTTVLITIGAGATLLTACIRAAEKSDANRTALVAQGKETFRYDTFGDETKWTDTLRLHEVIRTAVDPTTALSVGLKVDAQALPAALVAGIQNGTVDLKSPDTTVALLKLNAVVGVKGTVETIDGKDVLTRVGLTCAFCHSTVDNSFAPGIGKRLDGWPNRDLNVGAIIALSPALDAATKAVFNSWGPGKYDPRFNLDGKNGAQTIPPAYGLRGLNKVTATGDAKDLMYWNRYVGVTQMGGHGSFAEPRTGVNITNGTDDRISAKPGSLQRCWQVCGLPQRPGVHGRQLSLASRQRCGERTRANRHAQLRIAQCDQTISDGAVEGNMATRALFPQRDSADITGGS